MKNATKHAATLKSLCKKLTKQHKADDRPSLEPLEALVLGILREDADDASADEVMQRFRDEFVDINELRVATELELADLMGRNYPDVGNRSLRMRDLLMNLFDAEGRLTTDRIAGLNKKEQRTALRGVPEMTAFIEAHVALLGFGQAAIPLDQQMVAYLEAEEVLEPEASLDEAQKFLESNLKADECWPFFHACRIEAVAAASTRTSGKKSGGKSKKTTKSSK